MELTWTRVLQRQTAGIATEGDVEPSTSRSDRGEASRRSQGRSCARALKVASASGGQQPAQLKSAG
jgi:hypothetical protein